jgi:hypothetical protein
MFSRRNGLDAAPLLTLFTLWLSMMAVVVLPSRSPWSRHSHRAMDAIERAVVASQIETIDKRWRGGRPFEIARYWTPHARDIYNRHSPNDLRVGRKSARFWQS